MSNYQFFGNTGGGGGTGDVNGPASSTDNAITRFDGTTGKLIQNSTATLSDAGDIVANSITLTIPLATTSGGLGLNSYTTGDIIYSSAANTLAKLPISTNNKVLTIVGGIPSWETPSGGGTQVLLGKQTASNSSEIVFSGFLDSQYDYYQLNFENVQAANGSTVDFLIQFSQDSGSTFISADYDSSIVYSRAFNPNLTYTGGGVAFIKLLNNIAISGATSNGTINLYNLGNASAGLDVQGQISLNVYPSSNDQYINNIYGSNYNNTNFDAFRLYMSTGNILSGTVTLYGVLEAGSSGGGGGVTSVSAVAGRTTSTLGPNPIIDIDATWSGQTTLTVLGTVGTGTWNANVITEQFGGTAQDSYDEGDMLYASAANTLSKLTVASIPGQFIVSDGSLPTYYDPLNQWVIDEECIGGTGLWSVNGGGSGGVDAGTNFTDATHPGVWGIVTSSIFASYSVRSTSFVHVGNGMLSMQAIVRLDNLSDGTNRYRCQIGLGTDMNGAFGAMNNCILFNYIDNANSGQWQLITKNGGVTTTTNTTVAADTNYHNFRILVNAAGTSVSFYIDGSLVGGGAVTTNIPASTENMQIGVTNVNEGASDGSNRYILLDRIYAYQKLTSAR